MGDKVLITGGKGMLASAFAHVLRDHQPAVMSHDELDITSEQNLQRAFDLVQPTLVINCAAYTKVDQAELEFDRAAAVNGEGPRLLAKTCHAYGSTLVHFSTDYVFDGTLRRPLLPDDPVGPQSAYGKSKLLGERAIQQSELKRWLIVRTAWLYGLGGSNFVQTIVNAARAGKPLRVVNDQIGSPTYTMDLAEAVADLPGLHHARGICHLSNAGQTTWYDFAAAILEEFRLTADLAPITSADWKRQRPQSAARPAYSVLDIAPMEKLRNKPMPAWREALHRYRLAMETADGAR